MNDTRIWRIMGTLLVACVVGWAAGCGENGTTEDPVEGDPAVVTPATPAAEQSATAEDIAKAFAAGEGGKYSIQTLTIEGVVEKAEIDEMLNEPALTLKGSGNLVLECDFEESVMEEVAAEIETLKPGDTVKVRGMVTMKMDNSVLVSDCVIVE